MEASAKPAGKAAARRVRVPADKQNKLKEETASASASASAETEAKATRVASEPIDPRYIGDDIDLGTLTPEQLPELRRRAAVAKEEHEQVMARKREEHAAQQQATLEKEIAVEELRLQKLLLREEAVRRRREEAVRRRARLGIAPVSVPREATLIGETWVDMATDGAARGSRHRHRSPSRPTETWQEEGQG